MQALTAIAWLHCLGSVQPCNQPWLLGCNADDKEFALRVVVDEDIAPGLNDCVDCVEESDRGSGRDDEFSSCLVEGGRESGCLSDGQTEIVKVCGWCGQLINSHAL